MPLMPPPPGPGPSTLNTSLLFFTCFMELFTWFIYKK